jgi:hypothetical protein
MMPLQHRLATAKTSTYIASRLWITGAREWPDCCLCCKLHGPVLGKCTQHTAWLLELR